MSTKNSSRFTPVIIAISVVIGILIGTFYAKHFAGNRLGIINGSSNKLNALLRIVDDQYVDTVNMTDLVEKAMPQILAELDPHSTYIPAQNLKQWVQELITHLSLIKTRSAIIVPFMFILLNQLMYFIFNLLYHIFIIFHW